jgi:hypothetical protein
MDINNFNNELTFVWIEMSGKRVINGGWRISIFQQKVAFSYLCVSQAKCKIVLKYLQAFDVNHRKRRQSKIAV